MSGIPETTPKPPVRVRATTYTVSCTPEGVQEMETMLFDIAVEYAGHGRWAIRWMGRCLDAHLQWDYEPIPSSREDGWLDAHRFSLDVALDLAQAAAPYVTVNGRTASAL